MNAHQRRVASRRKSPDPVVSIRIGEIQVIATMSFVEKLVAHPRVRESYAAWVAKGRPSDHYFKQTSLT